MLVAEQTKIELRQEKIARWYLGVFPAVAKFIKGRGGDLEIAREIFQEAIVSYYEKLVHEEFTPKVSDRAYLMGITKNLWFKHCEQKKESTDLNQIELTEEDPPQLLTQRLLYFLQQSGKRCMDLLQAFYYEKLNMAQIASQFNYSGERSATVGKYKCLEKIRNEIKQKSLSYEDFVD